MKADIIIRNGRVIDPARNLDATGDIAVADGLIVDIAACSGAALEIDAANCLVTPGLIDFHAHVFSAGSDLCVGADSTCLPSGVTAVVDPGSAGTANLDLFVSTMLVQQVRFKCYMHVCPTGLGTTQFHEEVKPSAWDRPKMKALAEKHRDRILGLKIRLSKELVASDGHEELDATLEMAEQLGLPICVHTTNPAMPVETLVGRLRPGDVYCHVFHGKGDTIVDNGRVKQAVKDARQRGVIFDAANGSNHFAFAVAEAALADGFFPDVISTDITVKTLWKSPVFSLPHTLSKYLAMGRGLSETIGAATATPARLMGMEGSIGTLAPGALADVAVFSLTERETVFMDTAGESRTGSRLLAPRLTVSGGRIMHRDLAVL